MLLKVLPAGNVFRDTTADVTRAVVRDTVGGAVGDVAGGGAAIAVGDVADIDTDSRDTPA